MGALRHGPEAGPTWARGYDMTMLRAFGDLFRTAHKPHVYGAFGLIKERDIATMLADGAVLHVQHQNGRVDGALAWRKLRHGSKQSDFTGRQIQLAAGDIYVPALAGCDVTSAKRVLWMLPKGPTKWVEIFEEDKIAKQAAVECGYLYAFSKVMSGSEVKGVYVRDAFAFNVPRALSPAELATLAVIDDRFITKKTISAVLDELRGSAEWWAQHYSNYNKRGSWTSFALRGYDPEDPRFIIKPAEMSKAWKNDNKERLGARPTDTFMYDRFPMVREIVDRIPGKKDRVRFMRLAAENGELSRHADVTDREAGVADGKVVRLHIPVITNDAVRFSAWGARGEKITITPKPGCLLYLDQRKPHAVVNKGRTERVHLVVDAFSSAALREWLIWA